MPKDMPTPAELLSSPTVGRAQTQHTPSRDERIRSDRAREQFEHLDVRLPNTTKRGESGTGGKREGEGKLEGRRGKYLEGKGSRGRRERRRGRRQKGGGDTSSCPHPTGTRPRGPPPSLALECRMPCQTVTPNSCSIYRSHNGTRKETIAIRRKIARGQSGSCA